MSAKIARTQARRKAMRSTLHKAIDDARNALEDADSNEGKLMGLKVRIDSVVETLSELDDEIVSNLDPDIVEEDVIESMTVIEPTCELLASLQLKMEKLRVEKLKASTSETERVSSHSSVTRSCRLPKLELSVYKGEVLEWRGFEEQFLKTVHENEELSEIDKFIYLKRYLGGQALAVISGLSLSGANYKEAMSLLKGRYGNPQVLISAYMESLLKLGKVRSLSDISGLRKLSNDIENCVRNLRSMDVETSTYGSLLIPLLKERLPDDLLFHISRRFGSDIWILDQLLEYMNQEIQASENCLTFSKTSNQDRSTAYNLGVSAVGDDEEDARKCVFCTNVHFSSQCRKVTNVKSRVDILKRKRRCFVCLSSGHQKRDCPSKYICKNCNGRHHISICFGKSRGEKNGSTVSDQNLVMSARSESEAILLQTATAEVHDCWEKARTMGRIMFDSGSQRSFITDELRKKLKLKTIRTEKVLIRTFGAGDDGTAKNLDVVKFKIKHKSKVSFTMVEALCVPKICGSVSKVFDSSKYKHLCNLDLAESFDNALDVPVGVLIGIDQYHDFFTNKVCKGEYDGPVASETVLGWVLSGKVKAKVVGGESFCFHAMRCVVEDEADDLKESLERFWEVENIGGRDCVVHQFESDISHNGKRYEVKLPFKPDHDTLPDNFMTSKKRLDSLAKRLGNNKTVWEGYKDVFDEYEKDKIIEKVPENEIGGEVGKIHYLPHRPVVKENKETTKIRAVFDASCGVNGPSLNDCLYSGPNLLSKVFDVLLRFRLNKVAILADIKKAFLNVEVFKEHHDFLRFLWYDFESVEPRLCVYRFLRVVFGLTSSPFLLNGTIKHHLEKYLLTDKVLVKKLMKDFYVDDLVSGTGDSESGIEFSARSKEIMKEAGLELRKWVTNDAKLRHFFIGDAEFCPFRQVLGVDWNVVEDEFVFDFKKFLRMCDGLKLTKRNILSVSASFYDPLGFISPVTARVKVLFQLLCKKKLGWDDEVPDDLRVYWTDFFVFAKEFKFCYLETICF